MGWRPVIGLLPEIDLKMILGPVLIYYENSSAAILLPIFLPHKNVVIGLTGCSLMMFYKSNAMQF